MANADNSLIDPGQEFKMFIETNEFIDHLSFINCFNYTVKNRWFSL